MQSHHAEHDVYFGVAGETRVIVGVSTMNRFQLAVLIIAASGCSKPELPAAAVPCDFRLVTADGKPFADQKHHPDGNGLVQVFLELKPVTLGLEGVDLNGRTVREGKDWECMIARVPDGEDKAESAFIGVFMRDDQQTNVELPSQELTRVAGRLRPPSFANRDPNVVYFQGNITCTSLQGQQNLVLNVYPTADRRRAIPTSRSFGPPVPISFFKAEFENQDDALGGRRDSGVTVRR